MTPVQTFWLLVSCAAIALLILGAAWVAVHLRMLRGLDAGDWYE